MKFDNQKSYGRHKAISLAAVPSLTGVLVGSGHPRVNTLEWMCSGMPAMAPNITHLVIAIASKPRLEASQYTALKYLHIQRGAHPQFWQSLASSRLLEKIVLTGWTFGWKESEDWRNGHAYFPALRVLKIRREIATGTVRVILRSHMPMLEGLWWDRQSSPYSYERDLVVKHLQLHSPKLGFDGLHVFGRRWLLRGPLFLSS